MPHTINDQVAESAIQRVWRFEQIFHLGGMTADESLSSKLDDALQEETTEIALAVGVPKRSASKIEVEDLIELMRHNGKFGFIVQVATPVRTYLDESDSYQFSWGHYTTGWLYGEDLASLLPKIEAWVNQRCAEDRAKSTRKIA